MKPSLYLESDLFSEDVDTDTKGVISKYFNVIPIDLQWAMKNKHLEIHSPQLRASLEIARIFKRKYEFANALNWMPALRKYTITPLETAFTDLAHIRHHWMAHQFYNTFIRPCDGFKTFSGQVFGSQERFNIEHDFMVKGKNVDPYLMCMFSPQRHIQEEYRCIFIDGKYVSGSRYMVKGKLDVSPHIPQYVIDFAVMLSEHDFFLNKFEFVIDVASSEGGGGKWHCNLIEVNSLETASFYKADLDLVYSTLASVCKH